MALVLICSLCDTALDLNRERADVIKRHGLHYNPSFDFSD